MPEPTVLIYIGRKFYLESGTVMSMLMQQDSYTRYDWNIVERDLSSGKPFLIRPASGLELLIAQHMLESIVEKRIADEKERDVEIHHR